MKIKHTTDAFASLAPLINFIESKNTAGAGVRWLEKYEEYLTKSFVNAKNKRVCTNPTFKKINLR